MNLFATPEFKVGMLVVVVSGLIGYMSLKVSEGPGIFSGGQKYDVVVDDAGGLVKNSAVKMAGIKVGTIEDIILEDGKAKLKLRFDRGVPITSSSRVALKADGILGDRHVEIQPGKPEDPVLPSGSSLPAESGASGVDNIVQEISRVSKSLNSLMETLNEATQHGSDKTTIGRIVLNVEKITQDLAEVTDKNKSKLNNIMSRIENLSINLDRYLNEDNLSRVQAAVRNIEEITEKINRGEGTIGRLINDETTVEELNSAITNVNKFLGGADVMETSIDFHSEYMANSDLTKSYLGIKIQPGLDRYYEIQVIDDPVGLKGRTFTEVSQNGGPVQTEQKTVTFQDRVKFSALFAKNFYDFTVKGGIIENSGGVGFDYHFFDRRLQLSTEFFGFSDLYGRAFVRYNFFKGVYAIAGGDNIFSAQDQSGSAFVGGGIFITNDDLKTLASRVSF